MELLEFRNMMLELCQVDDIQEIGNVLMNVALTHDEKFYDEYLKMVDDTKDWLQALWQYNEADRTHKKQEYTPKSLCKLVSNLAGECNSLYDCCGGSGALTIEMLNNNPGATVYVEELDERVIPFLLFNLALHNIEGTVINADALSGQQFRGYILRKDTMFSKVEIVASIERTIVDVAISNPPYNIKWKAPTQLEALTDNRFPIIPPESNANYAFVLNCLAMSKGKTVMILPNEITSQDNESEIRQYLVDNDLIETIIVMPDKMFEATTISTCIMVLNKNKQNKGFVNFIDSRKNCIVESRKQNGQFGGRSHTNRTYYKDFNVLNDENIQKILSAINSKENRVEFSSVTSNEQIKKNGYLLVPSRYIEFETKENIHRNFQEIADNINYITRMQNSCKLIINETIAKRLGFDIEEYIKSKENSKSMAEQMKQLGIKLEIEDFIQFTKNKNEFVFKCNDKEVTPDIMLQFLSVWKNQVALLNSMQNAYLKELSEALLPELMSGNLI